jgi:ubiquinone/menaquinone biosynthesis C-methylase UbiE
MPEPPPEVVAHYESTYEERTRITEGAGRLELARTQEIIRRFLPPAPARVIDVGGGPGAHATWLAADGYDVDLIDPVERHVSEARAAASAGRPFTAELGDARALRAADETCDAALVLGPCYHLTERDDRVLALREARRVVRPGGVVFVAAVSRFASLFDGLARGFLFDPAFRTIVERDLADGQHRNDEHRPSWFTTAYFHRPEDLATEASDAGLEVSGVFGVEGLAGWIDRAMTRWDEPADRAVIMAAARLVETEPTLAGLSAHMLLVAHRA